MRGTALDTGLIPFVPAGPLGRPAHPGHPDHPGDPGHRTRCAKAARALGTACASLLGVLAGCSGGGGQTGGGGPGPGGGPGGKFGGGTNLVITPVLVVQNLHQQARTETVRASVPFPPGMVTSLDRIGVDGIGTSWLPLQKWPDGSVRIAQAQFTDSFAGAESKTYQVVQDVDTLQAQFQQNGWVQSFGQNLAFGAQVRDTFGIAYEAEASGLGRVVHESYLIRVSHHRVYHRTGSGGIGRDYLTSQFYVTEYRDMPFVTIDWILGNDYLGVDDPGGSTDPNLFPLGSVDVNDARFRIRGANEVRGYRASWHAIDAPVAGPNGWTEYRVMSNTHIADGQTRRYRFQVRFENSGASPQEQQKWRDSFDAFSAETLFPIADLETWQKSFGLGLHGGPVAGPPGAWDLAEGDYQTWVGRNNFGTWASFGEVQNTHTTGTPRNGPMSEEAGHAAQSGNSRILVVLEQMAWAQSQRPYHLYGLTVGAVQDILLWTPTAFAPGVPDLSKESLGRRRLFGSGQVDPYAAYRTRVDNKAHGWNGYDIEHWTTDLLFDYWTLTGDAWAKEELRQQGESLKGALRLVKYATAGVRTPRAEGWSMVGFVQSYLATGDEAMKSYALRRIHEIIVPKGLASWHPSKAISQSSPDPRSGLPNDVYFYGPWQHGAVMLGYLAAYHYFEDETALVIAEDVVRMLDYSWVRKYTHPGTGVYTENGIRYWGPCTRNGTEILAPDVFDQDPTIGAKFASSPLGSVNLFFIAGLHMLAIESNDAQIRTMALDYGSQILGNLNSGNARWNVWRFVVPQDYLPE